MLTTLCDKIHPKNAVVIAIDPQNDFCSVGGAMHAEGADLSMIPSTITNIKKFLDEARRINIDVVFTQNEYNSKGNWYLSQVFLEQAQRKRHGSYTARRVSERGTWGWGFVEGLSPKENEIVVTKHRFNAFSDTELDLILRSKGVKTLILTGFATNVCVETTARDGFIRDYHIIVIKDCVASYIKHLHEAALENIDRYFGEIVSSKDAISCWASL